ncbi:MAG: hypothetical protein ACREAN_04645 [Nitrosopumilaceae archaeon]
MTISKWVIEDGTKNQIVRTSTIKPRIDYAVEIVDKALEILGQRRLELDKSNLELYKSERNQEGLRTLEKQVVSELEISYAVESLRQVRRSLDSVVGLGNVSTVLSPTISIVRTIRSRLFLLMPVLDFQLGELSLLLGGIIIDAAHLASSSLDFGRANETSKRLLDEANLIAESKIYKQLPNLDFQ